jgi:hypothetical protein
MAFFYIPSENKSSQIEVPVKVVNARGQVFTFLKKINKNLLYIHEKGDCQKLPVEIHLQKIK